MKVVVTGGSGRIGSATARVLREAGHEVLTLDRSPPADLSKPHRVIDLADKQAVRLAFEGAEAVLHLGEQPNIFAGDWQQVYSHNTHIGSLVMETAALVGAAKLVYTSSCQVYGCWGHENGTPNPPQALPIDETHPLQPSNSYALAKVANETYARLLADRKKIAVAVFRPPLTYTTEMEPEMLDRLAKRRRPRSLRLDGLGTTLHVEDAATAYLAVITVGWSGFEAFHFASDDVVTDIPVRQVLAERYPHLPRLPESWGANQSPMSTQKARDLLGWRPKYSLFRADQERRAALLKAG